MQNALGDVGTLSLGGGILDLQAAATAGTTLTIKRNAYVITGSTEIISDKSASGSVGATYTMGSGGTLSMATGTLTVAGGANVNSGTAGVTFGATTFTGTPTFTVTNPANGGNTVLTLGTLNDSGTARAITLTGTSTGTLTLGRFGATSMVSGTTFTVNGGVLNVAGKVAFVSHHGRCDDGHGE